MNTDRVERLFKLIQLLQSGRQFSANDLAEHTGVDRRTVFRDLQLLKRTGVPFVYDRRSQRYRADGRHVLPPLTLTHDQAIALLMAVRATLGNPILPDAQSATIAAMKIESMLPPAILDHCGPLIEHMEIRTNRVSDPRSLAAVLPVLQQAMAQSRNLRVHYDSYYEGRTINVVLSPYRVLFINRGWYLIAFQQDAQAIRTFKVERIIDMTVMDETFTRDPDFNLDDYFGNAWLMIRGETRYHVKIRFLPTVAGNVEEVQWHKTQTTSFAPDGSMIFEVDVDGVHEISWWVLGYGDQAIVLEPLELRELVADRTHRLCNHYNDQPESCPYWDKTCEPSLSA